MRLRNKIVTLSLVSTMALTGLTGCSSNNSDKNSTNSATPAATPVVTETTTETATLKDGTYTKTAEEAENGYTYTMTMVVKDGEVTELNWDALDEEGNEKSQLSLDGKYVMTDTGLTWAEQSEALANYVLENQSVEGLTTDDNGKTDVVAGVSISISGFVEYAAELLEEAAN